MKHFRCTTAIEREYRTGNARIRIFPSRFGAVFRIIMFLLFVLHYWQITPFGSASKKKRVNGLYVCVRAASFVVSENTLRFGTKLIKNVFIFFGESVSIHYSDDCLISKTTNFVLAARKAISINVTKRKKEEEEI